MEHEEELMVLRIRISDFENNIYKLENEMMNTNIKMEMMFAEIEKLKTGPRKKLNI